MSAAVGTYDFCSDAVWVRNQSGCARYFLVKTWQPRACIKLVLRTIKRVSAAFANVDAFAPKRVVFACVGYFLGFPVEYEFFFEGELGRIILRINQTPTTHHDNVCSQNGKKNSTTPTCTQDKYKSP